MKQYIYIYPPGDACYGGFVEMVSPCHIVSYVRNQLLVLNFRKISFKAQEKQK